MGYPSKEKSRLIFKQMRFVINYRIILMEKENLAANAIVKIWALISEKNIYFQHEFCQRNPWYFRFFIRDQ